MAGLSLKNITKYYQNGHVVVKDFNLEIEDHDFVVLVGPEGCGRSTVLRMIAGLEDISSGELLIGGQRVNEAGPREREVAMIFENCTLYPQMSVYDNMAFGLKLKRLPQDEIDRLVRETAEVLDLADVLDCMPEKLTEAQKQLVAVGRAIARRPGIFLMDKPFSSRDEKTREDMQNELLKLYERIQTTAIYATGDPMEALKMGKTVVVMKDGTIQQADTPENIYSRPVNRFVAEFVGNPGMNMLDGTAVREGTQMYVELEKDRILLPRELGRRIQELGYEGKEITMGIRPEDACLGADQEHPDNEVFTVPAEECRLSGDGKLLSMNREEGIFVLRLAESLREVPKGMVSFHVKKENMCVFDKESGRNILR